MGACHSEDDSDSEPEPPTLETPDSTPLHSVQHNDRQQHSVQICLQSASEYFSSATLPLPLNTDIINYSLPMPLSSRFLTFELFCGTLSRLRHFVDLLADSSGDNLSLQNSVVAQCDAAATSDSPVDCM